MTILLISSHSISFQEFVKLSVDIIEWMVVEPKIGSVLASLQNNIFGGIGLEEVTLSPIRPLASLLMGH